DHRPREHLPRVAHALRKRAPQVEREARVAVIGETPRQAFFHAQTSRATFMISSSLRRVSSCVSTCPPPPALENPHCGLMPRRSRGTYLEAAAICFFRKSLDSSTAVFVLTRPRITRLPLGTKRSGGAAPGRRAAGRGLPRRRGHRSRRDPASPDPKRRLPCPRTPRARRPAGRGSSASPAARRPSPWELRSSPSI